MAKKPTEKQLYKLKYGERKKRAGELHKLRL